MSDVYEGTTIYNLLGAYVTKMIGYSTIGFFRKIAQAYTFLTAREGSTVKRKRK